jgi:5-methylcytosine-specific restriction endonuclease McrA
MIKIQRTISPQCLDTTSRTLTANDYAQDDVVVALLNMQHFKCCYCEKPLPELGRTANWVDHFVAKTDNSFINASGSINWNLANAWTNLLYACSTCNGSKGPKKAFTHSGRRNLIDPSYSRIDPETHIDFMIDDLLIVYKENSKLGKSTLDNLKLKNRGDIYFLLRKHKLKIDAIFTEIINFLYDGNAPMVASNIIDLERTTSAHKPFASFSRKYIVQKVNKFNQIDLAILNRHYNKQIAPLIINLAQGSQVII